MTKYEESVELDDLIILRLNREGRLVATLNDGPKRVSELSNHQPIREIRVAGKPLNRQTILEYTEGSFGMVSHPISLIPIPKGANAILIGEQIESRSIAPGMFYRIYDTDDENVPLENLYTVEGHAAVVAGTY